MLYVCNPNDYIFVIEPSANVDAELLKSKGCTFFDNLEDLYQKSADAQNLTVEEVSGCEFIVTHSKLHGEIACVNQNGHALEIKGQLENFISEFYY